MIPEQRARLEQWARTSTTGKHYVVPDDDSLFPALTAALAHIDQLRTALYLAAGDLRQVGNDYPGSSCQQWCEERAARIDAVLKEGK